MQSSLLTDKLYFPPTRPAIVHRPRLVDQVQAGLNGRFTLISAPAGSGKTTLLSEWRAGPGVGTPVAWVSLDAADNDPCAFSNICSPRWIRSSPVLSKKSNPTCRRLKNQT